MADPAPVHTFHASPAPPPTMRRYKRGRRQRSTSNGWLDVPGGCDLPAPAVPVPPPPVGGEMITLDFGNITRLIMLNSESKLVLDNLNITGKSLLPAAGQQRPGLAGAFRSVWASPARQAAPHHPLVPTRSLMVQRAVPPPPPPPPPAVCLQGRGPRRLACSPGRGRSTAPRCGPPSMANPATRWVCTPAALEASCCRFHWGVVDAPRGPGGAARSHLGRGSLRTAAMTC